MSQHTAVYAGRKCVLSERDSTPEYASDETLRTRIHEARGSNPLSSITPTLPAPKAGLTARLKATGDRSDLRIDLSRTGSQRAVACCLKRIPVRQPCAKPFR